MQQYNPLTGWTDVSEIIKENIHSSQFDVIKRKLERQLMILSQRIKYVVNQIESVKDDESQQYKSEQKLKELEQLEKNLRAIVYPYLNNTDF